MKIIKNMNLVRTSYTESSNEEMYAIIYCSGRDHDSSIEGSVEKRTAIVLTEEELQQEKDKFAVEFGIWISDNYNSDEIYPDKWHEQDASESFTTSELLNIYKKDLVNKK